MTPGQHSVLAVKAVAVSPRMHGEDFSSSPQAGWAPLPPNAQALQPSRTHRLQAAWSLADAFDGPILERESLTDLLRIRNSAPTEAGSGNSRADTCRRATQRTRLLAYSVEKDIVIKRYKTIFYVTHHTKRDGPVSWSSLGQELSNSPPVTQFIRQFLSYTPCPRHEPPTADRWVLTSNLHKAIRYGLVTQAVVTAEALFHCDPLYFYRRLPVIALEDVSLGNLSVCLEALTFCRDIPMRRKFQGRGLAGYLGARLAATCKSRSACDLLSLVAAQHGQPALESEITGMSVHAAMGAACSPDTPLRTRAIAFLRLDRLPIRNGDKRAMALRRVSEFLKLPATVADVLVDGNATHGLNALLPLVYELMGKRSLRVEYCDLAETALSLDGPILCAAGDQHTRLGQMAMKLWLREIPELLTFLPQRGLSDNADKLLGMTLFHIEGSLINRRMTNDCLESLREHTEYTEMASLGLTRDGADPLYEAMRRHLPVLNDIRRRLWRA